MKDEPTQTDIASLLRAQWHELWRMPPAQRRARIDEILRANKERA